MAKEKEKKDLTKKIKEEPPEVIMEEALEKKDEILADLREKYEQRKRELEEFNLKTQIKIEENPYKSVAIAASAGTLLGIGIGSSMYKGMMHRNDIKFNNYKKAFSNNGGMSTFSNLLRKDVGKKPYESLGVAIGLGVLIGAGINSISRCKK